MSIDAIPDRLRRFIVTDDFDRYGLRPGQPTVTPRYVQLELTDLCNLACAGCVRATHTSAGSHFGIDSFRALLDDLPDLEHVSFVGAGEALIVRDFAAYVTACTERGVFTSTNTNGLLVRRRIGPVVQAGLGLLAISVDGADDATLVAMRSGLTRHRLVAAIEAAVALTAETPTRLSAAVTLSLRNVHTFADIVAMVADLGVTELSVESLHHWGDDHALNGESLFAMDADHVRHHLEAGLHVAADHRLTARVFDYRRLHESTQEFLCPWPWDACYITGTGDVTPCCVNLRAEDHNILGNVNHAPIADVWNGTRYRKLRRSLLGDGPEWASCTDCVYRKEFGRARQP